MGHAETPPYFPFYPNDFVGDGRVEAMETNAVGAYILLLCKAWYEKPAGTLPDDDELLSRWARMSRIDWSKIKSSVMSAFTLKGSRWVQKRMKREHAKALDLIRKKAAGGSEGAKRRWEDERRRRSANGIPIGVPSSESGDRIPMISEKESHDTRTRTRASGSGSVLSESAPSVLDGGCKGETQNGVHRRFQWLEVQPIWQAYPEKHRGGNRGILEPMNEALFDLETQGVSKPLEHLMARVVAYAGSWKAHEEGGKYTPLLRNWLKDGQYNLPDSAWSAPTENGTTEHPLDKARRERNQRESANGQA